MEAAMEGRKGIMGSSIGRGMRSVSSPARALRYISKSVSKLISLQLYSSALRLEMTQPVKICQVESPLVLPWRSEEKKEATTHMLAAPPSPLPVPCLPHSCVWMPLPLLLSSFPF